MTKKQIKRDMPIHSKIAYTIGAFGNDVFYFTLSTYLINFITSHLINTGDTELNKILVSTITITIMVLRIVELLIDPFIGNAIDRTNTRWGHFRPWIVIGGSISAIILCIMFVDMGWLINSNPWLYIVIFAVLYIIMDVFYSFKDIGFWSMLPALTFNGAERERIASIARIGSTIGGNLVGVVIMPLVLFFSIDKSASNGDSTGWFCFGFIICVVALATALIVAIFTKEKENKLRNNKHDTKGIKEVFKVLAKNDQLLWTAISYILYCIAIYTVNSLELYYFQYIMDYKEGFSILQGINIAVGIIAIFLFPILSKLLGRRKLFNLSIWCMVIGLAIFFIASDNFVLVLIAAEMFFFPQSFIGLIVLMTITDSVEYGQLRLGHRDESLALSVRPLCDKLGSALSNGIVGQTAILAGMTAGASAATMTDLGIFLFKVIMIIIPAIVLMFALILYMKKVKLDETMHKKILEELKETWPENSKK